MRVPLLILALLLSACDLATTGDEGLPRPADTVGEAEIVGESDLWTPVCAAGERRCEELQVAVCLPGGDGWSLSSCPPGAGCVDEGRCEIASPRVFVIFDSSGSMLGPAVPGTPLQEPACGGAEDEGSRLAASKALFRFLFAEPLTTSPRMALFRFPQSATVVPECEAASYGGGVAIAGDTGAHEADGAANGWFRRHLKQVLLSGLPASPSRDGRTELLTWLDGTERIARTPAACTVASDCDDRLCHEGFCYRALDPELRGAGNTPLGKTLFYVGEYLRLLVLLDGRPCAADSDCVSHGFRCGPEGYCHDPLESCRTNHVLVFTDGQETANTNPADYFHPFHQARRLRWGLGCQGDGDCAGEATCTQGSCLPPGQAPADPAPTPSFPELALADFLPYADPQGVQRLVRADGEPLSVQVHVLDLWGNPDAALLAWFGGGEYVTGTVDDPEAVLYEMDLLFRSKASGLVCEP